ncbi:MAG: winged helix-turn-helix transcriptional regulator, partial [Muribaculaceae bacterium]|nr:winged helix-turn-helix transcriptional regulator [Muribaculaceae bacterium]
IMLNLGYVNRFGSGVNTVSTLLEENKSNPAEFLLGDYTTFKVVVQNADVIENGTDGTNKSEFGTDNGTDGTKRNNSGTISEQSGTMSGTIRNNDDSPDNIQDSVLNQIRKDKRISIKQLSKMFNKTRASMFRIIEKLKADGRLRRVGSLKSGTWEVIE